MVGSILRRIHNMIAGTAADEGKPAVQTGDVLVIRDGKVYVASTDGVTDGWSLVRDSGADAGVSWADVSGGGGGGGGAPTTATYVVVSLSGSLSNERELDVSGGLSITDNGANNTIEIGTDADLTALAGLSGTGHAVRTGAGTWDLRSIAVSGAGLGITNGSGVAGNPTLALADDVAAIEALASTGLAVRTGTSAWTTRSLVVASGSSAYLTVTNGNGVSGNLEVGISPYAILDLFPDDTFGDASDGNLTLTGDITLTYDVQYDTLDLAGHIINTDGFRVRCRTLNDSVGGGIIRNNGQTPTSSLNGIGAAGGSLSGGTNGGQGGNPSSAGSAGSQSSQVWAAIAQLGVAGSPSRGGTGGISGGGQNGGAAGAATTPGATLGYGGRMFWDTFYWPSPVGSTVRPGGGSGGGGGGCTAGVGARGGGGGGGGGVVGVWAFLVNTPSSTKIQANGGNGGPGTAGASTGTGGGGGGGGGASLLIYAMGTNLPTLEALGGSGGAPTGTGSTGSVGNVGYTKAKRVRV